MMNTKLRVKNMVCDRCIAAVKREIERLGWTVLSVGLGEAEIAEALSEDDKKRIDAALGKHGFELIQHKKSLTAERIKNLIVGLVHRQNDRLKTTLSNYIASEMGQDYSALSNLFSQQCGVTIEQFYILQKVERIKELLEYGELNLTEIAAELNYSSSSHLARQFKKATGKTPTEFKNSSASRVPINRL